MDWLTEVDLAAIYGAPAPAAMGRVADHVTADYAAFIDRARFCILATVGPEGLTPARAETRGRGRASSIRGASRCPTGAATTASTACATLPATAGRRAP